MGGGGFSPGQGTADNDVPHFDREGHFRRQESVDERARVRRMILAERAERAREGADTGVAGRLGIVCFVLGCAGVVALWPANRNGNGKEKRRRER